MCKSERIFGHSSGKIDAPIMFIGEAPGRLGADESAIPVHGDKAGDNFERLLAHVGLTRYDLFITNAVLCNPKDENGNNSTPTSEEIENCAQFLRNQIKIVDPKVIVTLGAKALFALGRITPHNITLTNGVRKVWDWGDRKLISLYHPGQRAMIHRSFFNQLGDYEFVAETWRRTNGGLKRRISAASRTNTSIADIATTIIKTSGSISYFGLHKIFYLVEYHHMRRHGSRISKAYIVRQKDGPYVTDLHLLKLRQSLVNLKINVRNGTTFLSFNNDLLDFWPSAADKKKRDATVLFVEEIAAKLKNEADGELKRRAYLTSPMRKILRREKYHNENLFNSPLDFSLVR